MSTHTPGPWKAWQRDADKGSNYWLIRTASEKTGLEDTLRGYCGEANARLIAAAPDLLEALEGLLECISETRGKDATKAVAKALAVIAKAEGKQ